MRNIVLMILNTLRVTFRKKGNIIVYIFLPLVGIAASMMLYGGSGTAPLRIGLEDLDSSRLSGGFSEALKASEGYRVEAVGEGEVKESLLNRRFDACIILPRGYEKAIFDGSPLKMELVSIKGQDTTIWLEHYINAYTRNLADMAKAAGGEKAAFDALYDGLRETSVKLTAEKLEDEGNGKQVTLSSMGFLIMFVMLGAGFTSQLILNEKRSRTYYRICSAPVGSRSYIAANTITSLIIVIFQVIAMQAIMKLVLRMETYVPDLLMFLILVMFGLTAIGICLVVTAFSSSSYMASTLNTLILTPTCMLGGCFWPVYFMPEAMQKTAFFVPQRWALDAIQKIQSGLDFGAIAMNLAVLLAFSAALFAIATYRFSRTEDMRKFV